jgi:hypothetical protein
MILEHLETSVGQTPETSCTSNSYMSQWKMSIMLFLFLSLLLLCSVAFIFYALGPCRISDSHIFTDVSIPLSAFD